MTGSSTRASSTARTETDRPARGVPTGSRLSEAPEGLFDAGSGHLVCAAVNDLDVGFLAVHRQAAARHALQSGRDGRIDHERLDLDALVGALSKGERLARCFDSVDALYVAALDIVRAGDVLATMSSGSFERLPNRLLEALEGRNG